jgi:hypothetical protein
LNLGNVWFWLGQHVCFTPRSRHPKTDVGFSLNSRRNNCVAVKGKYRWVIEAKGCGSRQPMRVNYFLAILGETLQRMDDPGTRYSIALPDMAQFRGLWERLPELAKERTKVTALFIRADGQVRVER